MELLKDYDFSLQYYPRKENVVVDPLSWRSHNLIASLMVREWLVWETIVKFDLRPPKLEGGLQFGCLMVQLMIISFILGA